MTTYTPEQLTEIIRKHALWLRDEDGGERADLTDANLYGADLTRADLTDANLYGANLTDANLYGANLTRANLYGANLTRADLTDANLTRANLYGADLYGAMSYNGTVGNMRNVKSVQADYWPVTYTATHMQIGCQLHTLTDWWAFGAVEIQCMDSHATAWWAVWKPILQTIIAASPAEPTGYEPQEAAQ